MKAFLYTLISLSFVCITATAQSTGTSTFPKPEAVTDFRMEKPHFGVLVGATTNDEGDRSSHGNVGIDIGYQPYVPFGIGFELSGQTYDDDAGNRIARVAGLFKGTYNFGGDIPLIDVSYIGFGAGPLFKENGLAFVVAPMLGFDVPLSRGEKVTSLGANAKYMFTDNSTTNSYAVNAVIKYWY